MSKIAGIYWDDTAAAPGISLSVYFSGCPLHCPGCHNPEAQDFNFGEEFTNNKLQEIISKVNKNGVPRTLSILGGEPLCDENLYAVLSLVQAFKCTYPDNKIYIWSGYTLEELTQRNQNHPMIYQILCHCDYLIEGRYVAEKRDITLPLRGSSNQKIIYIPGALNT